MGELRFAFRTLARTPIVSLVVILSLAFGIGANTAIFSMTHQILLRALPVMAPEELVFFYHPGPVQGRSSTDDKDMPAFSYLMFRDVQQLTQGPFTGVAGFRNVQGSASYANNPLPVTLNLVSGNYFELLGVRPAMGRLLTMDDDRTAGGHNVVVLSHSYWTNMLGARVEVLNQPLVVNGHAMTIVGVAAKGFQGETAGRNPEVYVPIAMKAQMTPNWDGMANRRDYWVSLVGRVKKGMSVAQAAEQINGPYHAWLQEDAKLLTQPEKQFLDRFLAKKILLRPANEGRGGMRREAATPLLLLMGMTAFVLLIACANAANLLLARAQGRRKEIAIRLSIGAGRGRIIRQLLAEALLLSVSGGVLGLLVARWTLMLSLRFIPAEAGSDFLSSELSLPLLLYSMAVSVVTGLLFGLYPALQATKPDVAPTLKDQGTQVSASGSAKYFRSSLVVAQIALSMLLLFSAGLFSVNLVKLTRVELGLDADRLITFSMRPELANYNSARSIAFFEQLEDKIAALPGVTMVSASKVPLLSGSNWSNSVVVEGFTPRNDEEGQSQFSAVGPAFFATMGIALVDGREFSRKDAAGSPRVVVVNEAFVRRYFNGGNALGRRMGMGAGPKAKSDMEIVGVVKDSKYSKLQGENPPVFYLPYRQDGGTGSLNLYVRTAIDPGQIGALIRRAAGELDPNIPVVQLKTMRAQVEESIFVERLMFGFAGSFAGLATLLAAIGLYGVLAYTVARRTREIGIRMALGADAGNVRTLILRDVLLMLGVGLGIGLFAALAAGRLFESLLYNVKATDPEVVFGAAALLGMVALLAGSIPAWRATKVDPMVALRYE